MKKKYRDKYEATVVRDFKLRQKEEFKLRETEELWRTFGYLIPNVAAGWVIGTVLGYGIVAYLLIRWIAYPLYTIIFGE